MIAQQATSAPEAGPHLVSTTAEARALVGHLGDVMDALLGLVEEETALVRAGRLSEVARLERTKADLANLYLADATRVKLSSPYLKQAIPDALDGLRRRHDTFHALLQINLTVLATAQAVSEGIMRGVSNELVRKASPRTYGASGRQAAPGPRMPALPLAVSRML
jgi:hypothetical protein